MLCMMRFISDAPHAGVAPCGVRAAFVLLAVLLLFGAGDTAIGQDDLPECPDPLPDWDLVTSHYRVQCGHCYAVPTATPTALSPLPTATNAPTATSTATATATLTLTPSASATFSGNAWESHLIAHYWELEDHPGYYEIEMSPIVLESGYASPLVIPPLYADILALSWNVYDSDLAEYQLSVQPAYGGMQNLVSDIYETFPFGITSPGCMYAHFPTVPNLYEGLCLHDGWWLTWPNYADRTEGVINWVYSTQPYMVNFGFTPPLEVPTPSGAASALLSARLLVRVPGGSPPGTDEPSYPTNTPTSTGTITATNTQVPTWYWSEPLLGEAIADHPGDSYWHEPILGTAAAAENIAAIVLKVTETGNCDVETRFRVQGEGWVSGGQNQPYAVFYGNNSLSTIQTMFADKFPGITPYWSLWAYNYTIYPAGTNFEFSARIGWNCYGSQWSEAWFLYYGEPPGAPTLPPTWTYTPSFTPRPTKTDYPTMTPSPTKTPFGYDDSCLVPDYRTSPTPGGTSTVTASPTIVTPTASNTPESATATFEAENTQVAASATMQWIQSTPENRFTATWQAQETRQYTYLGEIEDNDNLPPGVGANPGSDGWISQPDSRMENIPDTSPGDIWSDHFSLDINMNTKRGKCYVLVPTVHEGDLPGMSNFQLEGVALCVTWVDLPKGNLFGFPVYAEYVLLLPVMAVFRRFIYGVSS